MPKKLHQKLSREATKKGLTGKRRKAYIYGTLNKKLKPIKTKKTPIIVKFKTKDGKKFAFKAIKTKVKKKIKKR